MEGKISNPLCDTKRINLFFNFKKINTPEYKYFKKKGKKLKFIFLLSFALLITGFLPEIHFKNSLLSFVTVVIIEMYFVYYIVVDINYINRYDLFSIISEETYISFEQDYFLLSTNIREVSIRYDDPYLQIKKIFNDFHFICYWGEFTFSKTDIIEGKWEDFVALLCEKIRIKE